MATSESKTLGNVTQLSETDEKWLRRTLEVAQRAREEGNMPFGAILVDPDGEDVLLEGENTVLSESDCTGHAEISLIRQATRIFDAEFLAKCTLYASTEPCAMCAGAIHWSCVGRLVYALSTSHLRQIITNEAASIVRPLYADCRSVLSQTQHPITVLGPAIEHDAIKVHQGYWADYAEHL